MSKCRPSKWILPGIVGAGLPLLGAAWLYSGGAVKDINERALGALSGNDATKWAKVETDGRDATITGTAPSDDAVTAAVQAVAGTYGVRTVAQNVSVVPPPPVAPTVESLPVVNNAMPVFKGTWPESKDLGLTVKVGETPYVLNKDKELASDGKGNWTLTPSKPLPEGMVHVLPEVTNAAGAVVAAAAAAGMATIDLTPPAAPMLAAPPADAKWPYAITGTWGEEPGAKLSA